MNSAVRIGPVLAAVRDGGAKYLPYDLGHANGAAVLKP